MSPHVGNFVQDLVEMAKAVEELPAVKNSLAEWQRMAAAHMDHITKLEENIIGYKREIEELHNQVRSLEVARDDAEFRFLEADDTLANVLAMARASAVSLGQIVTKLDPPKVEPTPVVIEERAEDKIPSWATSEVDHTGDYIPKEPEGLAPTSDQSEADPTSASTHTTDVTVGEQRLEQTSVTSSAITDATSADPSPGPYFGKRYHDVEGYVSEFNWYAGGGSTEDYFWRPERNWA